jgi:hypothetical protein
MICIRFQDGQGLGNQLWLYVVARSLAKDLGVDYGVKNQEKFKGSGFLELDFGSAIPDEYDPKKYFENRHWHAKNYSELSGFDSQVYSITSDVELVGNFQSEQYIEKHKNFIGQWLHLKNSELKSYVNDDVCILNIRGGDYRGNPELILPRNYWVNAMSNCKVKFGINKFAIVTDDISYAAKMFPDIDVHHECVERDYFSLMTAKYLVLSNSSFAFFPVWLNKNVPNVIAPMYWARHNFSDGYWGCEFNLYKDWNWQSRSGALYSYEYCLDRLNIYKEKHQQLFTKSYPHQLHGLGHRIKRKINHIYSAIKPAY